MPVTFTIDAPTFMDINRGKLNRLILLAAYQLHESTGALIDRLEERDEGRRTKTPRKRRRQVA